MKSVRNNICSCFLRSIVASALTKNPKECTLFICFLNTSWDIISNSSFEYPGISFHTNSLCNQTGIKRKICSCFNIWKWNLLKIKQLQLLEALMKTVGNQTISPFLWFSFAVTWSFSKFAPTGDWRGGQDTYTGFSVLVRILQGLNSTKMFELC